MASGLLGSSALMARSVAMSVHATTPALTAKPTAGRPLEYRLREGKPACVVYI